MSAQTPPPTPTPDWEQIKKDADAQRAAIDAQKLLLDSRKALDAAQNPALKASDDRVAAAKTAKDLADAQKALADSRAAAFKATLGDVPASGYTGSIDLKDKAGATEATLLATRSLTLAAKYIADGLPKQPAAKKVMLYALADAPTFQSLIAFRAQTGLVQQAFANAQAATNTADNTAPAPADFKVEAVPIVAAAGAALDTVNKLFGFFRTDYTVGGLDTTLDDSLLVQALAGAIAASDRQLTVQLPALYSPALLASNGSTILTTLTGLALLRTAGQDKASRHSKLAIRFADDASKAADAAAKARLVQEGQAHQAAADAWKSAFSLYDSLASKIATADDKGTILLSSIMRDDAVADALMKGTYLLIAKLQKASGTFYTKKNMWTFFGGMPFFIMGGVVVNYAFLDGPTGTVLKAGAVPVHGGFVRASSLDSALGPTPK